MCRPPTELAENMSASIHSRLMRGDRLPKNLNPIADVGLIQTVVRPSPVESSSIQVNMNDSPRLTCRCASTRSSKSTVILGP